MSTKQMHAELVETAAKIRSTRDALQTLRVQHASQKARLTEARAAKKTQENPK